MSDFEFKVDDFILVFTGYSRAFRSTGIVKQIISVDKLLVESSFFSSTFECEVSTSDVCLLGPYREGMRSRILACLWHPVEIVSGCKKNVWWSQQADGFQDDMKTQPIWDAYQTFLTNLKNDKQNDFENRSSQLVSLIDSISDDDLGTWWQEHWKEYIGRGASECQAIIDNSIPPHPNEEKSSDRARSDLWIRKGIELCKKCDPALRED